MKKIYAIFLLISSFVLASLAAHGSHKAGSSVRVPESTDYRAMTLRIRSVGEFSIPFPGVQSSIKYHFDFDKPVYDLPMVSDHHVGLNERFFYRMFWDRVLFKDGSFLEINGEKLPLTCVFIDGQDNRFSNENPSPLFPEFVVRVYLVANDYACQGPKRAGWPQIGGKEESWDTYLYFEIRDPTIMLPTEAKIRYRWNEYHLVLVDRGEK
ncbi:hypothetical protein [Bdellovibrio bacteriovorus]|uniref:hypothetical protein n=1 Tax=Bdellovibrio bacteriovorus TaxID=959 RepID=UPI0035A6C0DC